MEDLENFRPKDLSVATTEDMLIWRDQILRVAVAHFEKNEVQQAEAWLRRLEETTVDSRALEITDIYLAQIAHDRKVVASFDCSRKPMAGEVVIIYGNSPQMYDNVVVNNPIRRHVGDFWKFQHDKVESDPRWSKVDHIFLINLRERVDRYDAVLRELATAKAPLDRFTHFPAVEANPTMEKQLGGTIGCLESHVAVLRQ